MALDLGPVNDAVSEYGLLSSYAVTHGTDKGPDGHHFTRLYEALLRYRRRDVRSVLEVGIDKGASLRMWADWFPNAKVYGIDKEYLQVHVPFRVRIGIADQADRDALRRCAEQFAPPFDLVVEDGGHEMIQQQVSLAVLLPMLVVGGWYFLEDLHTSFWYRLSEYPSATTLELVELLAGGPAIQKPTHLTEDEMDLVRSLAGDVIVFGDRNSVTAAIRRR